MLKLSEEYGIQFSNKDYVLVKFVKHKDKTYNNGKPNPNYGRVVERKIGYFTSFETLIDKIIDDKILVSDFDVLAKIYICLGEFKTSFAEEKLYRLMADKILELEKELRKVDQ